MIRNLVSSAIRSRSGIRCLSSAPNNLVNVDVNDKTGIAGK